MDILNRIIAIGTNGTSFADLSAEQLPKVKLNTENTLFAREQRTNAQLALSRKGLHQDSIGYDTRSYVQCKADGNTFWLGTLQVALAKGLVIEAKAMIAKGDKTTTIIVYARKQGLFDEASKGGDQFYAANEKGGRIESSVKKHGEKRRLGSVKNKEFVRDIRAVTSK